MDPTSDYINQPKPPIPPVHPPHGGDPENDHDADDTLQSPPPHNYGHIIHGGPADQEPFSSKFPHGDPYGPPTREPVSGVTPKPDISNAPAGQMEHPSLTPGTTPPHWVGPPIHEQGNNSSATHEPDLGFGPGHVLSSAPIVNPPDAQIGHIIHQPVGPGGLIPPEPVPPHEMPPEKIPGISFNPNEAPAGSPNISGMPAMPGATTSGTNPSSSVTGSGFENKEVSATPISAGVSGVNLGGESIAINQPVTKPDQPISGMIGGATNPLEQKPDLLKPWNTPELTDDAMGFNPSPPGKPKI